MIPFKIILAAILLLLASCNRGSESTKPVVQDIAESVYASGLIKSVNQYDVFSPANGIILECLVTEGDSVSKGDTLFIVDNTISKLGSENARLSMELLKNQAGPGSPALLELESRMVLATDKKKNDSLMLARQRNLWEQGVGAKVELEQRELAYKTSLTEYKAIQLQYNLAKSELEKAYLQAQNNFRISTKQQTDFIIKSQITGTVYDILKEPGELISAQFPVAVIGETGKFEIELQVDEYDIVKIQKGQKVFLSMDSYRGEVFEAAIRRIEPLMNERTRTFIVWAEFTRPPVQLYPNLSVEANILIAKKQNVITIPSSYLLNDSSVLTAADETTFVKTGIRNLQWTEITSGITEGREIYLPSP